MAVDIVITYLFDRLQRPRRDLHLNETLQGLGEEPLIVRVREPCPPRLLLREWYVVAGLHGTALEETQLGPFEGHADRLAEASGGEHGGGGRRGAKLGASGEPCADSPPPRLVRGHPRRRASTATARLCPGLAVFFCESFNTSFTL